MTVTILVGDAREQLRTLPDDSVHMCLTSPPYWALRSYGGEPDHTAETVAVLADGLVQRITALSDEQLQASFDVFDQEAEQRHIQEQFRSA